MYVCTHPHRPYLSSASFNEHHHIVRSDASLKQHHIGKMSVGRKVQAEVPCSGGLLTALQSIRSQNWRLPIALVVLVEARQWQQLSIVHSLSWIYL